MEQAIKQYLDSKRLSWSPTTLRSEGARLYAMQSLLALDGASLYKALTEKGLKPYTIKTAFTRIAEYRAFTGDPSIKQFIKANANLFKNAYTKERLDVTIEEARERIARMESKELQQMANFLLATGLRAQEALSYDGSGTVMGKGARKRRIFNSEQAVVGPHNIKYIDLYNGLKSVGLKPHTLRKLAATALVGAGFKEADLMYVMGWNNIQTASSYLQPQKDSDIERKMKEVLVGSK